MKETEFDANRVAGMKTGRLVKVAREHPNLWESKCFGSAVCACLYRQFHHITQRIKHNPPQKNSEEGEGARGIPHHTSNPFFAPLIWFMQTCTAAD